MRLFLLWLNRLSLTLGALAVQGFATYWLVRGLGGLTGIDFHPALVSLFFVGVTAGAYLRKIRNGHVPPDWANPRPS